MQGVRLGIEELIGEFAVSRRLAVRVGALLAKNLTISATLLEIAGPGSPIEKLLLHKSLLDEASTLNTATLRKLAADTGADAEGDLVVTTTESGPVIALEEEVKAENAADRRDDMEQALPARMESATSPARFLDESEKRGLFKRDEIARLKLEALAGKDADSRISAIRKLIFAPISAQEKGGICIRALADSSSAVRGEAIKALESLGFNRDTADAVRLVLEGNDRNRASALRRLGDLIEQLRPAERRVVMAVLLEMFRESTIAGPRDPLLALISERASLLETHAEFAEEFTRVAVQHLLANPIQLGQPIRELLSVLADASPANVKPRLWEEIQRVSDPLSRALLLGLLIEHEEEPAAQIKLCEAVADELARGEIDEVSRQKLGHSLTKLEDSAADALIQRFKKGSARERAALAPFMDILACDGNISDETRNRIAEQFAAAVPAADTRLAGELLRSRVFALPQITYSLKAKVSRELMALVRRETATHELVEKATWLLEMIGEAAAQSLLDFLKSASKTQATAASAARLLGEILSSKAVSEQAAEFRNPAVEFFIEQFTKRRNPPNQYALALARILTHGRMQKQSRVALELLMERLGNSRRYGDLIEAISLLAAEAPVAPEQRVRVAGLLLELLDRPAREDQTKMREVQIKGGKRYEITGSIDFDSEALPAAVRGLSSIVCSEAAPPALRERIIRDLLRIWGEVAGWKVVWGPRASQALADSLGTIGACPVITETLRAEIITALAEAMDRISVVRAFKQLFASSSADDRINALIIEASLVMIEQWVQPETNAEELEAVIAAAVEAAVRPALPPRKASTRSLRAGTAELLFAAMAAGHPFARPMLERMRDCPDLPQKLHHEIEERLARPVLVKITKTRRR